MWYRINHCSAAVAYKSEFGFTKYTPYLALTSELWGAFCEDLGKNWLHYNTTAQYKESCAFLHAPMPYNLTLTLELKRGKFPFIDRLGFTQI